MKKIGVAQSGVAAYTTQHLVEGLCGRWVTAAVFVNKAHQIHKAWSCADTLEQCIGDLRFAREGDIFTAIFFDHSVHHLPETGERTIVYK